MSASPAAPITPSLAGVAPTARAAVVPFDDDLLPQQPVILSAVSRNPRFRAHHSPAQDSLIEEMIDETLNARMITKASAPLAFVVPEGADSVEFSYGPIELDQNGKDGDLDLVVTVGTAEIQGDVANGAGTGLVPGSALMVTIPWRAASFVQLPANHLSVTVYATFFRAAGPIEPLSATS